MVLNTIKIRHNTLFITALQLLLILLPIMGFAKLKLYDINRMNSTCESKQLSLTQ